MAEWLIQSNQMGAGESLEASKGKGRTILGTHAARVLLFAVFLSVSPNSTPPKWCISSLAYGSGWVSDWSRAGKFKCLQLVICYNFVQPYFENMGCENWVPLPKHSKADSETLLWWKPWETLHIGLGQLYNVSLISFPAVLPLSVLTYHPLRNPIHDSEGSFWHMKDSGKVLQNW